MNTTKTPTKRPQKQMRFALLCKLHNGKREWRPYTQRSLIDAMRCAELRQDCAQVIRHEQLSEAQYSNLLANTTDHFNARRG